MLISIGCGLIDSTYQLMTDSVPPEGTPWTPANITTAAWYDASDTSPTNIVQSGGAVSQWSDKSGNTRHALQGTASLQPTTGYSINSLNAIYADQDYLSVAIAAGTFPTSFQTIGVIQKTGDSVSFETFVGRTLGAVPAPLDPYNALINVGNGTLVVGKAGTDIRTMTSPTILSILVNTTIVQEYVNGNVTQDITHGTTYGDNATTMQIGSRASGATRFRGLWGEIIITAQLSDADRQKMEGYLAWKWGLVSSLPVDHPYKSAAPTV